MKELYKQTNAKDFYQKELERLLGEDSVKPILALQMWLWFPYADEVKASVGIRKKGEKSFEFLEVQTGRPLHNKNIVVVRRKFGKSLSKGFLPIVFDSVEELQKVEKVSVVWTIGDCKEFIVVEYDVLFEEPEQSKVYALASYEYILNDALVLLGKEDTHKIVNDNSLDPTRLIVGTSMYDDVYFMIHQNFEMKLVREKHAIDSTFRISAFKEEDGEFPLSVNAILMPLLSGEFKNGNQIVPVSFYHSVVELDDERIIHF